MNNLRSWYKAHIDVPFINAMIKNLLRFSVNILALAKGIKFPKKYDWDWKLEMLLKKYEKETTALAQKLIEPGMIILDIGAHIGYYTKLFSKLVGKNGVIYAFEPEEENFQLLKENAENLKNVRIINKAVSDSDGFIDFWKAQNNTGHHSILSSEICQEKITVPVLKLDNFIKNERLKEINLIKIDIEGGEPYAFRGAQKLLSQMHLKIIMEFAPDNFKSDTDAIDFLKNINRQFGFSINKIGDRGNPEKIEIGEMSLEKLMDKQESINLFLNK